MGRVASRFQSVTPRVSLEALNYVQRASHCRDKGTAAQGWVKYFGRLLKEQSSDPQT